MLKSNKIKKETAKNVKTNVIKAPKGEIVLSSSSEDELDDVDEDAILNSLYKHYEKLNGGRLNKTASFLENVLHSGAATCLICIGSVRRAESIWTCKHCFCFFHLSCIKRWANDSIKQLKAQASQHQNDQGYYNHLGEFIPPKKTRALLWCCPQCRGEFQPEERPTVYECFCGKEENPISQPWLVPHTCGEICGKRLKPECGHSCVLLCHPGPCPPCAQYAVTSCLCGKAQKKSVRCSEKNWQCKEKCKNRLACKEHLCNQSCHEANKCPPCSSSSLQACECGNEKKMRNCAERKWHCQRVCGLKLSCGFHKCKRVCHTDACGECPLSLPRSCPCGKSKKISPCTDEAVDTCGDTCQKLLSCGQHTCTQRCHRGDCILCLVITKKKCRCGLHDKEIPCWKSFTCETKCKQMRDCGKHACNRKCCDGRCPPCDKVCGKTLSCKKHKCQSVCHDGLCFPCERQSQVNCRCGKTSKNVPCGRERTARVVCLEYCRIPSKCHHTIKHRCHKNECPPCSQKCDLPNDTTGCAHKCEAKCHAAVKVFKPKADLNNIWESSKKFEFQSLPHPQCEQKVKVTCIGGHETAEWPCWNSKPSSCQHKCKRSLRCGTHKCELVCHAVPDISDMKEQTGCGSCQEGCNLQRPLGCTHACARACHLPPCHPCNVIIKTKCHCGLSQVIYKCSEYYKADCTAEQLLDIQKNLKSCGNRCLKNFPCGHRCTATCHYGECPNPQTCRKKVRIFCECKLLKSEISCDKHRNGLKALACDENCKVARAKLEEIQRAEAEKLQILKDAKNRLEVENFEKKFSKRKPKERKVVVEKTNKQINWKTIAIYAGTTLAVLIAIAVAFHDVH